MNPQGLKAHRFFSLKGTHGIRKVLARHCNFGNGDPARNLRVDGGFA